jgi:hypothetical protein
VFGDPAEYLAAEFFVVVEGKFVVRPALSREELV